jgi:hypothetical protein
MFKVGLFLSNAASVEYNIACMYSLMLISRCDSGINHCVKQSELWLQLLTAQRILAAKNIRMNGLIR